MRLWTSKQEGTRRRSTPVKPGIKRPEKLKAFINLKRRVKAAHPKGSCVSHTENPSLFRNYVGRALFPSLHHRKEGWLRHQNKFREATEADAAGVVFLF